MKKIHLFTFIFLLIQNFAFSNVDPWYKDKTDWTNLMKAIYHGKQKKIDKIILKANGDLINFKTWNGLSALNVAIRLRDNASVRKLLDTKLIIIEKYNDLILLACVYNSLENVKLLFNYGFPIINSNGYSESFMEACKSGDIGIVQFFLEKGVDINQQFGVNDYTPLIVATINANIDVVKVLLDNGADKELRVKYNDKKAIDYVDISTLPKGTSEDDCNELLFMLK